MFKKSFIFYLFIISSCTSTSKIEQLKLLQGDYLIQKGSHSTCTSGQLRIVGDGDEQGVRIGHHIYLGPFNNSVEAATKNSCRVSNQFSMLNNEITVRTIVDNCPCISKNEAAQSTEILNFRNKEIIYTSVEIDYICVFLKQASL